jgi:hypothetical protein
LCHKFVVPTPQSENRPSQFAQSRRIARAELAL